MKEVEEAGRQTPHDCTEEGENGFFSEQIGHTELSGAHVQRIRPLHPSPNV